MRPPSLFWKYRDLFLQYRGDMAWGLLALLATNALGVAIPWLVKQAIDSLGLRGGPDLAALQPHLWGILLLACLTLATRLASRMCIFGAGRKIEYDLRNRLYRHLLTMPAPFFTANPTGELMSRLTNDVGTMRYLTGGGVLLGFNTLFAYATALPMMWLISPNLTIGTFLIYPLAIWLMSRISGRVKQRYYQVQNVLGDISTIAQENLSGMVAIQAFAREPDESRRFNDISGDYLQHYRHLIRQRIVLYLVMWAVAGTGYAIALAMGGVEVIQKTVEVGGLIAFTLYLERLTWPTMAMGWAITIFQQGSAAMQRIDEVLAADASLPQQRYQNAATTVSSVAPTPQGLCIRNLNFSYHNPYQTDAPGVGADQPETNAPAVLSDLSLEVPPNRLVALVGAVGAGKSTLLKLIPRLYEPPPQTIFLDGQDITQHTLAELRERVTLMPQHSFLFSLSVGDNIAYSQPDWDIPNIHDAATIAAVHDEIIALPQQYQTVVGERGILLSGGQRQRVSLARTLLTTPQVLLLDDPFSNVDADTEREIISALVSRKWLRDKITLVATHRFSLVQQADWVVFLIEGRIAATGTHDHLMQHEPRYQELNRLEAYREQFERELPLQADSPLKTKTTGY